MFALTPDAPSPQPFVLVILDKAAPPQVRFLAEVHERSIEIDGERFLDAGLGDWIGFYDWLRTEPRAVIGVTLWPDTAHEHLASVAHCLYFSLTTLATVGYGDFVARSDLGHTLAVSEALIGQIYLVTVVSLIVSNLRPPPPRGRTPA